MPIESMVGTRDEPPNDTSGSGMPVIGSRPTTAPMFTTAWVRIQPVDPAAASRTNWLSVRCATRSPA